jgi:hypothetical protein
MATVEEEFQKHRASGKRPIAGQSLANDPENPAPYEKAPEFTSVHRASEYLWESFIEPKTYVNLMQAVDDGVPVMNLVQVVLFAEFQEGAWNPDLMLMLVEPAAYMIIALAERLELNIVIDNEKDDDEIFGVNFKEDKIKELKGAASTGAVPAGVLTPEMQQQIEELPETLEETSQSLLAPTVEEEEEQSSSLMARPTGV